MKSIILLVILLFSQISYGQQWKEKVHFGLGLTYGSLNSIESIAGGFSVPLGYNLIETENSSFSLSTNIKFGAEDKTGLAFPGLVILSAILPQGTDINTQGINDFAELPLLIHYNFGLGSRKYTDKETGFYFGGGMNYLFTGYTDTSGNSLPTSFWGYTIDGGIRFNKKKDGICTDLNFGTTISLGQSVGQINRPQFFEITLSFYR